MLRIIFFNTAEQKYMHIYADKFIEREVMNGREYWHIFRLEADKTKTEMWYPLDIYRLWNIKITNHFE